MRDLAQRTEQQFTSAACNAVSPSWEDSQTLLYASDCGRGLGLSAMVRVNMARVNMARVERPAVRVRQSGSWGWHSARPVMRQFAKLWSPCNLLRTPLMSRILSTLALALPALTASAQDAWQLDPPHLGAVFRAPSGSLQVRGAFAKANGSVLYDPANPGKFDPGHHRRRFRHPRRDARQRSSQC